MHMKRSSNSSLLDDFNSTSLNATQLAGNDFKDPILVSAIAVNGICAVSFAILAIAAHWVKDKKARGRYAFGVLAGLLGAMFLSFVDATGIGIANELASTISFVSIVLSLVKNTIDNGTDTTLIFVVYSVIMNRLSRVMGNSDRNSSLRLVHLRIASVTALLGFADAAVGDYAQIITNADGDDSDGKIHVAYTSVYCAVALEMLACAAFIFKQSRLTGTKSRISTYLVSAVTPFLVIRSVAALALGVIYVYLGKDEQKYTGLVNAALLGITAVVMYTGLVFIGFQKDWYSQDSVITYVSVQQDSSGAFMAPQHDIQSKVPFFNNIRTA